MPSGLPSIVRVEGKVFFDQHIQPFLNKTGMTIAEIAGHLNLTTATLYAWRNNHSKISHTKRARALQFMRAYEAGNNRLGMSSALPTPPTTKQRQEDRETRVDRTGAVREALRNWIDAGGTVYEVVTETGISSSTILSFIGSDDRMLHNTNLIRIEAFMKKHTNYSAPVVPDETDKAQLQAMGFRSTAPVTIPTPSSMKKLDLSQHDEWINANLIASVVLLRLEPGDRKRLLGKQFPQLFPSLSKYL